MLSNDIIPVVVELLKHAQVDGQYAATALLYNMAASSSDARVMLGLCRGTEPLIRLLCHDSWCAACPWLLNVDHGALKTVEL